MRSLFVVSTRSYRGPNAVQGERLGQLTTPSAVLKLARHVLGNPGNGLESQTHGGPPTNRSAAAATLCVLVQKRMSHDEIRPGCRMCHTLGCNHRLCQVLRVVKLLQVDFRSYGNSTSRMQGTLYAKREQDSMVELR